MAVAEGVGYNPVDRLGGGGSSSYGKSRYFNDGPLGVPRYEICEDRLTRFCRCCCVIKRNTQSITFFDDVVVFGTAMKELCYPEDYWVYAVPRYALVSASVEKLEPKQYVFIGIFLLMVAILMFVLAADSNVSGGFIMVGVMDIIVGLIMMAIPFCMIWYNLTIVAWDPNHNTDTDDKEINIKTLGVHAKTIVALMCGALFCAPCTMAWVWCRVWTGGCTACNKIYQQPEMLVILFQVFGILFMLIGNLTASVHCVKDEVPMQYSYVSGYDNVGNPVYSTSTYYTYVCSDAVEVEMNTGTWVMWFLGLFLIIVGTIWSIWPMLAGGSTTAKDGRVIHLFRTRDEPDIGFIMKYVYNPLGHTETEQVHTIHHLQHFAMSDPMSVDACRKVVKVETPSAQDMDMSQGSGKQVADWVILAHRLDKEEEIGPEVYRMAFKTGEGADTCAGMVATCHAATQTFSFHTRGVRVERTGKCCCYPEGYFRAILPKYKIYNCDVQRWAGKLWKLGILVFFVGLLLMIIGCEVKDEDGDPASPECIIFGLVGMMAGVFLIISPCLSCFQRYIVTFEHKDSLLPTYLSIRVRTKPEANWIFYYVYGSLKKWMNAFHVYSQLKDAGIVDAISITSLLPQFHEPTVQMGPAIPASAANWGGVGGGYERSNQPAAYAPPGMDPTAGHSLLAADHAGGTSPLGAGGKSAAPMPGGGPSLGGGTAPPADVVE